MIGMQAIAGVGERVRFGVRKSIVLELVLDLEGSGFRVRSLEGVWATGVLYSDS
jgi:hypothetical protein